MRRILQLSAAIVLLALAGTTGLSTPGLMAACSTPEVVTGQAGLALAPSSIDAPQAFQSSSGSRVQFSSGSRVQLSSGSRVQATSLHAPRGGGTGAQPSRASGPSSTLRPEAVEACQTRRLDFWSADALARAGITSRYATAPPRFHSA